VSSTSSTLPESEDRTLESLGAVCTERGTADIAERLDSIRAWLATDLAEVEEALDAVGLGSSPAFLSAEHLLSLKGKRLRPICVALGAHTGPDGFNPAARELAVSAELIHNATLLHDDVIDVGDRRRGKDTARVIYGNAASLLGGDWLLTDALGRVQSAGIEDVFTKVLATIKEMIRAESEQLTSRGRLAPDRDRYFRVIDGKTASLFAWALYAGVRAGGGSTALAEALERYGRRFGRIFQLADDLLDLTGDPTETGKAVFTDLREGKMTYPVIVAAERDPALLPILERIAAAPFDADTSADAAAVREALEETGAVDACRDVVDAERAEALRLLAEVPAGRVREGLEATLAIAYERSR